MSKAIERVAERIDHQARLLRKWRLAGGVSAQMTALEVMGADEQTRKVIVRQPGEWALKQNPQAAADEFRLLHLLSAAGLPTPTPYHLDQSGEIFPTPYLVIEYIEGKPEFAPTDSGDFVSQVAATLARIHQINPAALDLSFLPKQKAADIAFQPAENDSADAVRIRDMLAAVGPLTRLNSPVLLHGDFWPGDLLWKDGCLVGVIDWEDAHLGDPLADFAISRLDLMIIFGAQAMKAFTQHYQAIPGFDFCNLPYWDLRAALRAAPNLAAWAAIYPQLGRTDITEQTMRERHRQFVTQAFEKTAAF